jgi:predicted transcriptional regulator
MNEEKLISHVEELGLSNKEARVYVACLKTGAASVQRIADQSGIKRVTTYVILESLVGLGLVSQTVKGKKTLFIAEDPSNLRRIIEKREQELQEQKSNFEQVLPGLLGLKMIPQETPNVKFYDSVDGIKGVMKTFLSTHKKDVTEGIYGITNVDQLYKFFPEIKASGGNPTRLSEGVHSRIIYTYSGGPIYKETDQERNRESRWVPADKFPLTCDISIVGSHIIMLSLTGPQPIGITIDSTEIAQGLIAFFKLAWVAADQYNQ